MTLCKRNFQLPPNFDESLYGFKTKQQQILLADIGDLVKTKKKVGYSDLQTESDFYDNNLKTDTIILRDLVEEAQEAVQQVQDINDSLKKQSTKKQVPEQRQKEQVALLG